MSDNIPDDDLPKTEPFKEPDFVTLLTTQAIILSKKIPEGKLAELVSTTISSYLDRVSTTNLSAIRVIVAKILSVNKILEKPLNLFLRNNIKSDISVSYIHLDNLNFETLLNLYVSVNEWIRAQARARSDKYMSCYMILLDDLPTSTDRVTLELLGKLRYTFPNKSKLIYFKILVKEGIFFNPDGSYSLKGATLLELLERSKLGEIVDLTTDQVQFIDLVTKAITDTVEK